MIFQVFVQSNTSVKDFVRTIHSIHLEVNKEMNQLHMVISGNGFLYNMVRIIAGTFGKLESEKKVWKTCLKSCSLAIEKMLGKQRQHTVYT